MTMTKVAIAEHAMPVHVVVRRLINEIRDKRKLDRITIVCPTYQASFYLRRALAKEGLFNVDFTRLEDVAEYLVANDFRQPLLHDLQASEFVFEAARDPALGTKLGGELVSPQLQTALHSTFRQLELLDRHQLDVLAAKHDIQGELVARFEKYLRLATSYRRGALVAGEAAKHVRSASSSERLKALGTVLLIEASPVAPTQRSLFHALSEMPANFTVKITRSKSKPVRSVRKKTHKLRLKPIGIPDVAMEVRSVVREIVNQARSGKRFNQLAVVFEDDSYSNRIAEALDLAGIPVSGPDRTALIDTPEGQFVNGLLDVFERDFNRLQVTAWLANSPIKNPKTGQSVTAARWDAISRIAGVTVSVEDSWIPRLARYSINVVRHAERSVELEEATSNQVEAARSDAKYASDLKDFIVALAKRKPTDAQDSWSGFGKWLRRLVDDYLLLNDLEASKSRVERLLDLVGRLESLETQSSKPPSYDHCAGILREQLGRRSAGLRSLGAGVYVGPLWTAAGCPFDTVFMLGMVEGRYPSPSLTDPLLPDPLKREIDPEGVVLKTVEQIVDESEQSFISVMETAERVFMYWPSGIPGEPRQFGPSRWFLDAVRRVSGEKLLQAGRLANEDIPGLTIHSVSDKRLLLAERAGDQHEYDVISSRNWSLDNQPPESFPLADELYSIKDSVKFNKSQQSDNWTEYDGNVTPNLTGPKTIGRKVISETVGSATAFETYAACPYRYFLSRYLHIEPTDSPEQEIALDALEFGTLIHDVLEKFGLWRMKVKPADSSRIEQEAWLKTSIVDKIDELKSTVPGRSDGAWKIEESRAWLILRHWLRRESYTAQQPEMRQIEAEYSFGGGGIGPSVGPAVEVRTKTGGVVRFRGQVDRVDISSDGSRIIVYDYKSGGHKAYTKLDDDPVKKGTKIQLPLYSKAIGEKYPDAEISASYWFVRESDNNELKPPPGDYKKDKAETALTQTVETIVQGIDNGIFPARPGDLVPWGESSEQYENCKLCEYARVCPKSKARLWDTKKDSAPALESYVNLAESGS